MVRWTRGIKLSTWAMAKGHGDFPLGGHSLSAPSLCLGNQRLLMLSIAPLLRQPLGPAPAHSILWRKCVPFPPVSMEGRWLWLPSRPHPLAPTLFSSWEEEDKWHIGQPRSGELDRHWPRVSPLCSACTQVWLGYLPRSRGGLSDGTPNLQYQRRFGQFTKMSTVGAGP